ncbi:hypothetical protein Areg01_81050 [Actinoplanes regularis]|nr:hypothetical protein Areg01_81050 [Actinoplanes regularis]
MIIRICGRDPNAPETLYHLGSPLAEGGQAVVYPGRGPGPDGPKVTVRVWRGPAAGDPRPPEVQYESWNKGAVILRTLSTVPGICRSIDDFIGHVWDAGGRPDGEPVPVQVLEWIEGQSLAQRMDAALEARPGGELDGTGILRTLAGVLRELSRRGPIIHQDIEPNNVLVTEDGRAVLIDFTSARNQGALSRTVGKLNFASPELLGALARQNGIPWDVPDADTSVASDVFGFGTVALCLISRVSPRTGWVANLDGVSMPAEVRAHLMTGVLAPLSERTPVHGLETWIDDLVRILHDTGCETPGVRWDLTTAAVPSPPAPPLSRTAPFDPFLDEADPHFRTIADLEIAAVARPRTAALPAAPQTRAVLTLAGYPVPAPPQEKPAVVPVPRPRAAPAPSIRDLPDPEPPGTRDLPSATRDLPPTGVEPDRPLSRRQRYLLGIECVQIPAVAAAAAWAVWIVATGRIAEGGGYGPIFLISLFAAAAELVCWMFGLRVAERSPGLLESIAFHRALHVPAGFVFAFGVLGFAFVF